MFAWVTFGLIAPGVSVGLARIVGRDEGRWTTIAAHTSTSAAATRRSRTHSTVRALSC